MEKTNGPDQTPGYNIDVVDPEILPGEPQQMTKT